MVDLDLITPFWLYSQDQDIRLAYWPVILKQATVLPDRFINRIVVLVGSNRIDGEYRWLHD